MVFRFVRILCFCVCAALAVPGFAQDRRMAGETEFDFRDYVPFSGGKTAAPDEAPSLRFKRNLPRLDGATAAFPVYAAFVQALYPRDDYFQDTAYFPGEVSGGKIVRVSTTRFAYEALVDGRADIIFCYAPSEEQAALAAERGLSFRMIPVCKDAFVFFVNAANPVRGLTAGQIRSVYAGRVANWKELGGRDEPIAAYQRNEGSGSQTAFLKIMAGETVMTPPREQVARGMMLLVENIAYRNSRNALGYSFRFFLNEMAGNSQVRTLAVDGVEPTVENIAGGAYPFTETLYAITTGNESPETRALLDWIVSEEGQRLVAKTGYVPVSPPPNP